MTDEGIAGHPGLEGRWEHFSHGADVGVRGIGPTPAIAFAQAARALTAASAAIDAIAAAAPVEITCTGTDLEDLFYGWLNALVFEMSTRRMLFSRFDVEIRGLELHAVAWGEPVAPRRHQPAVEVKGATLTALGVRQQAGEWIAECVVDV